MYNYCDNDIVVDKIERKYYNVFKLKKGDSDMLFLFDKLMESIRRRVDAGDKVVMMIQALLFSFILCVISVFALKILFYFVVQIARFVIYSLLYLFEWMLHGQNYEFFNPFKAVAEWEFFYFMFH